MSSRLRDIASSALGRLGLPGIADVHILTKAATAGYSYWEQFCHGNQNYFHTDIETALDLMTTGRNDVLLVAPDSHSQADTITWSKNMTHLVGMYPPTMLAHRSRIGHSAALTSLIDITGYGNLFANLQFQYGYGTSATDLTCANISGNRNTFMNVHFASPMQTAQADQATFKVLNISETSGGDGLEHYFKDCVLGIDTVVWTNGDMIKISGTPRLVFEDSTFLTRLDNGQVTVLDGTVGDGDGFIIFKNCLGANTATAMTVALGSTGWGTNTKVFLAGATHFLNCGDVIAAADEAKVYAGMFPAAAADDIFLGLGQPFDHTA